MSAPAAKFMPPAAPRADMLPWLEHAPQDNAPAWVKAFRATGAETFAATGFPTAKTEYWQYTNLRPLNTATFTYTAAPVKFDTAALPAPLLEGASRIVVVNGQYQPQCSDLPPGVTVMNLMDAVEKMEGLEEHLVDVGDLAAHPFKALNAAHMRDGFILKTGRGTDVEKPVEVLFYNTGNNAAVYPRVLYWLGENAGITIVEHHTGIGTYFTNMVADIVQEDASRLKLYRLQDESPAARHISQALFRQHKGADFEGFCLSTGAEIAREECRFQLLNSVISASISGIYLIKGQQNHDFTIVADHFEPDGKSGQYFKGVVDDEGRAVFQGKTQVRRPAQRTDGYQAHHALLLSGQAEASAKPELEIYADDVKCSHGATSGSLDPVAMFYLRSRGIPAAEARAMLIKSFLSEALGKVSFAPIRDVYQKYIDHWLEGRQG